MLKKLVVLAIALGVCFGVMMLTTGETTFAVENDRLIEGPPDAVWATLADVPGWPFWWPGVKESRLVPDWRQGATLELILEGTPETTPAVVEAYSQGSRIVWARPGILGSMTRTTLKVGLQPEGMLVVLETSLVGPQAFMAGFTGKEKFAEYQALVLEALQRRLQAGPAATTDGGA